MDFGEVLSRAWKIIWKNKILWIFGILASCSQGGNGGGGGGGGGQSGVQFDGGEMNLPPWMDGFFRNIERFFENLEPAQIILFVIAMIVLGLVIWAITLALSTVGKIGLIQGTQQADGGAATLSFGQLFNDGKPYFWRILLLDLLVGIAGFLLVLILILPVVLLTIATIGIFLICLIPLICLMVPIGWLISAYLIQANVAIVVEDLSIIEGLQRGWEVFRDNFGNLVVMALILLLGGGIIGFLFALPMGLAIFPLLAGVIAGASTDTAGFLGGGILVSAICFIGYLPVLILLNGVLQTYIYSAWTLTYLRLTGHQPAVMPSDDVIESDAGFIEPPAEEEPPEE